jgi:glycosyltransferase involved in cell wall biosynthesis
MLLSIIIPVYNGEFSISSLISKIKDDLSEIELEIILVNDGSQDKSEEICEMLSYENPEIKFLSLRNNFGEHNAVMCGLNYAHGDYSVIIDDDFQNPPSEIKKLLYVAIKERRDIVYTKYKKKHHSLYRNLGSKFHNYIASYVLNKPNSLYLSSFKLIHKDVVQELIKYKGPNPYIDGLLLKITNNIGSVEVDHHPRKTGRSNYSFAKLFKLYMNMFINHSIRPIRFITFMGLICFLGFLPLLIFSWKINEEANVFISGIICFTGLNMFAIGLVGEYVSKIYMESVRIPQYTIKKAINANIISTKKKKISIIGNAEL